MSRSASGPQADDFVRQARTLLELHRPAEAARSASLAIADSPSDPRGWGLLSLCHSELGEHRHALDAIGTAVRLDPNNADWHLQASHVLQELDRKRDSIRAAKEAVRLNPTSVPAHAALAIAHARRGSGQRILGILGPGDVRSAERHARQAISLDPTSVSGQFAAGYVAAAGRRRRAARKHYLAALAIDPHHVPAQNNLAVLDLHALRLRRGGRGFVGVLQAEPSFDKARINVLHTVYLQLAVFEAVAWGLYLMLFIAVAGASAVPQVGYTVTVGPRTLLALVCSAGYLLSVAMLWKGLHPALRGLAARRIASDPWLWLNAAANAFMFGCLWVVELGSGAAVAKVYLAGLLALPFAVLTYIASKSRTR